MLVSPVTESEQVMYVVLLGCRAADLACECLEAPLEDCLLVSSPLASLVSFS